MYTMTDFSWRLLKLRRERELSGQDVAKHVGCSPASLSAYENGKREPAMENLIKLAKFYGVSIDYLCGREDAHDA